MTAAPIIYEPKGRAREYAPLACNLAIGCTHRCRYCFGPATFRRDPATWDEVQPKADALARFERDAARLAGDPREILFSFSTDPCGTPEQVEQLVAALSIAERHRLRVTVLTKNPAALLPHAGIFARNGWRVGTTICFLSEAMRETWEPGAPNISVRLAAMVALRAADISTWASVEPVVDAAEGLRAIAFLATRFDEIRVGHWNHDARARAIDWRAFHAEAERLLTGHPHLFKADLLAAAGITKGKDR